MGATSGALRRPATKGGGMRCFLAIGVMMIAQLGGALAEDFEGGEEGAWGGGGEGGDPGGSPFGSASETAFSTPEEKKARAVQWERYVKGKVLRAEEKMEASGMDFNGTYAGATDLRKALKAKLRVLQKPKSCRCARALLMRSHYYGGFGSGVHQVGWALMVALATDRTLVLLDKDRWDYTSKALCSSMSYTCYFEPPSSCSEKDVRAKCPGDEDLNFKGADFTSWEELRGEKRVVSFRSPGITLDKHFVHHHLLHPNGPLKKYLTQGKFVLRSEIQRYLWVPNHSAKRAIDERAAAAKSRGLSKPYVGVHMRITSNLRHIRESFGVPPLNYHFSRWMYQSLGLLKEAPLASRTSKVFLATDSEVALQDVFIGPWEKAGLKFFYDARHVHRQGATFPILEKAAGENGVPPELRGFHSVGRGRVAAKEQIEEAKRDAKKAKTSSSSSSSSSFSRRSSGSYSSSRRSGGRYSSRRLGGRALLQLEDEGEGAAPPAEEDEEATDASVFGQLKEDSVVDLAYDIMYHVHALSKAEFLVGSMFNNVFRLAVELMCSQRNYRDCFGEHGPVIQTMDAKWYQDP